MVQPRPVLLGGAFCWWMDSGPTAKEAQLPQGFGLPFVWHDVSCCPPWKRPEASWASLPIHHGLPLSACYWLGFYWLSGRPAEIPPLSGASESISETHEEQRGRGASSQGRRQMNTRQPEGTETRLEGVLSSPTSSSFSFSLTLWPHSLACRVLVPWPGIGSMPLWCAARQPGKSPLLFLACSF